MTRGVLQCAGGDARATMWSLDIWKTEIVLLRSMSGPTNIQTPGKGVLARQISESGLETKVRLRGLKVCKAGTLRLLCAQAGAFGGPLLLDFPLASPSPERRVFRVFYGTFSRD